MTTKEAYSIIEKISYRKDHKLSCREMVGSDLLFISLDAMVPCAILRDGTIIRVQNQGSISLASLECMDEHAFLNFIYRTLVQFEVHEAGEWLKFGDTHPFNPHERIKSLK